MTFINGKTCHLRVLEETDQEAAKWQRAVMAGLTTHYLFTGSYPMRHIDVKKKWQEEREAGDVLFGIHVEEWKGGCEHSMAGRCPNCAHDFVGTVGLHGLREIYHSAEFRILIFHPDAIGKGIGTEATRLLVDYGFSRLNLNRIWLGVHEDNKGAIKCYEKAGFKIEGRLREELFTHGKYWDAVRMGILRKEWESTKPSSSARAG